MPISIPKGNMQNGSIKTPAPQQQQSNSGATYSTNNGSIPKCIFVKIALFVNPKLDPRNPQDLYEQELSAITLTQNITDGNLRIDCLPEIDHINDRMVALGIQSNSLSERAIVMYPGNVYDVVHNKEAWSMEEVVGRYEQGSWHDYVTSARFSHISKKGKPDALKMQIWCPKLGNESWFYEFSGPEYNKIMYFFELYLQNSYNISAIGKLSNARSR